jgi:hypothetical protein
MDISAVKRTRSFAGENTAALAKYAHKAEEAEQSAPVTVKVEATLERGTYTLVVSADGQSATRSGVEPADLADVLASIIERLSKAVAAGDLKKHRQPQEPTFRATDFTRKPKSQVFSGDRA